MAAPPRAMPKTRISAKSHVMPLMYTTDPITRIPPASPIRRREPIMVETKEERTRITKSTNAVDRRTVSFGRARSWGRSSKTPSAVEKCMDRQVHIHMQAKLAHRFQP